MSFPKVLCIAVVGSIIVSGAATARPDTTGQPPVKTAQKAHHRHRLAKLRKMLRKHHHKHQARRHPGAPTNTQ